MRRGACLTFAAVAIAAVAPAAADARYKAAIESSGSTTIARFTESSATPNAADLLVLREDGTKLRHNRKDLGDSQFASGLDFDTSQTGNQYISSDSSQSVVVVHAGGGADAVRLGLPGFAKTQFQAGIQFRGDGGDDHLVIDDTSDIFTRVVEMMSSQLDGYGGVIQYVGIERLTLFGSDSADILNVHGTPGVTNLITRDGPDTFKPGPGASLKGGFFAAGAGDDTIDYTSRGSGSANLTKQRYFEASLDGAQQVPPPSPVSTAFGYGAIRINPLTDVFDVDVLTFGLTRGPITASHIHRGLSGSNGAVIFELGTSAWLPAHPTAHASLAKVDRFDPDTNPALDVNTSTLMGTGNYFNIHTNAPYAGGEIRGQIFGPFGTAGPASATKFAAGVETVIPAP